MSTEAGRPDDRAHHGATVDWEAAEALPEFQELVASRRRFVLPATIGFLAWYLGFILLAGYAPDFMGESLVGDLTVGYGLALTQFVMVWGLGWLYLRKADREFDPLAERATRRALELTPGVRQERPLDADPAPARATTAEGRRA